MKGYDSVNEDKIKLNSCFYNLVNNLTLFILVFSNLINKDNYWKKNRNSYLYFLLY